HRCRESRPGRPGQCEPPLPPTGAGRPGPPPTGQPRCGEYSPALGGTPVSPPRAARGWPPGCREKAPWQKVKVPAGLSTRFVACSTPLSLSLIGVQEIVCLRIRSPLFCGFGVIFYSAINQAVQGELGKSLSQSSFPNCFR